MYVSIFQNAGTVANYVRYIRWACRELGTDDSWMTDRVRAQIKGLEKLQVRLAVDSGPRCLLTRSVVSQVARFSHTMNDCAFAAVALICWECLRRVQSEGLGLEMGSAASVLTLPAGRHSSVFVDSQRVLHVRLRRRKHRQMGSVLKRPCTCSGGGLACASCAFLRWSVGAQAVEGQQINGRSAAQFLHNLRRTLALLAIPRAQLFTLKAFRAGHATELVRAGASWARLLEAGEWCGEASLRYVDSSAVDAADFVSCLVEASSDEGT